MNYSKNSQNMSNRSTCFRQCYCDPTLFVDKRWFSKRQRINSHCLCKLHYLSPKIFVGEISCGVDKYFLPLLDAEKCPEKYRIPICDKNFCEAEFAIEFVSRLFSRQITGLRYRFFTSYATKIRQVSPLKTGSTNLVVLVTGNNGEKYILKGYRKYDSFNLEPLFFEYLRNTDLTPGFVFTYFFGSIPLGIVTRFLDEAEDGGKRIFESALDTLKSGKIKIPRKNVEKIVNVLFRFHEKMYNCTDDWCKKSYITSKDIVSWKKRVRFYNRKIQESSNDFRIPESILEESLELFEKYLGLYKIKIHQDLHFSQMLYTPKTNQYYIVDFEGEPGRPPGHRKMLEPATRDLATLIRGVSYISFFALKSFNNMSIEETAKIIEENRGHVKTMRSWARELTRLVLSKYVELYNMSDTKPLGLEKLSIDEIYILIKPWIVERALYEIYYELNYRKEMSLVAYITLVKNIP